jgi:diguanylate cyclase (GGDEF)-like protein
MSTTVPVAGPARSGDRRRAIWVVYGLLTVVLVGYLAVLLLRPHQEYSTLVDGWLVDAFEIAASGLCLARGFSRRRGRAVPLVLGASILSWSLGDLALTVESLGGRTPSTPSVADLFYLAFYPLAYIAVVLYIRREAQRLSAPSWLDGLVAGLGAAAVCATFAFHSIVHSAGGGNLSVATNLAYPIGDVLLLTFMVGATAVLSVRRKTPWILLAVGMGLNVIGDTVNVFGSTVGSSKTGSVLVNMAWPAAILLISMSMWLRDRRGNPFQVEKPPSFLLPGLAATAGLVILFVATLRHPGAVAVGLATATLAAVGVRMALSVKRLRVLTVERHQQSITDDLTLLGNRRYLFQVLEAFFADQVESDPAVQPRRMAFLFIDLNHFKEINDTFGHPAGDGLLKQLGQRFTASLRTTDTFVRLGGDEFAAVLLDADAADAAAMAQRLCDCLDQPFTLDAVSTRIGASIGIALAPSDATDGAALIWCADVAMYRAKLGGVPFALYDHDLDDEGNRLGLAEEIGRALEEGQLVLHYQPQLELATGEINAVEALVRWPHPQLGLLPPVKFLPVAEEAGLMGRLTSWVLTEALSQCARWRAIKPEMVVAVNISPTNLLDEGLVDLVRVLLEKNRLPAAALVIEITETSIITEFERSKQVIEALKDLGIAVSVDDFGAGFTSLAHLSSLAIRELKLDRTFITRLADSDEGRDLQLVRATVDLAHAMGLRVVAEGVEDGRTLELLSELGCDLAQGYFISVPKPASELIFRSTADLLDAATPLALRGAF